MPLHDAEARTSTPFSPPPASRPWVMMALAVLAVALALALAVWLTLRPVGGPGAPSVKVAPAATPSGRTGAPMTGPTAPPVVAPAPRAAPQPPVASINKCLQRGRTSYSDGPCPAGATTVEIELPSDVNLMQAPALPPPEPPRPGAQAGATAVAPAPTQPQPGPGCIDLARRIDELDAMARAPQPASVQDWIAARKREARDLQFRLKC